MKTLSLLALAFSLTAAAFGAEKPVAKQFENGVSGLGYRWALCREGDAVHYVVFSHGPRPAAVGEARNQDYVKVANTGSRHPKAALYYGPKESRDLLTAPDQLYQVDHEGHITTSQERVTAAELKAFIHSQPKEYTVAALLAFVHQLRAQAPAANS